MPGIIAAHAAMNAEPLSDDPVVLRVQMVTLGIWILNAIVSLGIAGYFTFEWLMGRFG
ncbi:hypothetical protein [Methylobacterium sp. Gmos1]